MRRCSSCSSSWPPTALVLLLCFSHCVAAARLLPPPQPAPLVLHQAEVPDSYEAEKNGVMAGAAGSLMLQEGEAAGSGDKLSIISEMMGAEAEEAVACEEGNAECLQRRLLLLARLDYAPVRKHPPSRP